MLEFEWKFFFIFHTGILKLGASAVAYRSTFPSIRLGGRMKMDHSIFNLQVKKYMYIN